MYENIKTQLNYKQRGLLIVFFLVLGILLSTKALAKNKHYIDAINKFSVSVPKGWGAAPKEGRMVWHVANKFGTELPNCLIKVTHDWSMSLLTPKEYIDTQSEAKIVKMLSMAATDIHIGVWEPNFQLGGKEALHYIYTAKYDDLSLTTLILQTINSGSLYTFGCNAPTEKFPSIYKELLDISESFTFL